MQSFSSLNENGKREKNLQTQKNTKQLFSPNLVDQNFLWNVGISAKKKKIRFDETIAIAW